MKKKKSLRKNPEKHRRKSQRMREGKNQHRPVLLKMVQRLKGQTKRKVILSSEMRR
jgi:hypothetical protein